MTFLSNFSTSKEDVEDAVIHFKAALRLRPDFTGARENLDKATELRENWRNGPLFQLFFSLSVFISSIFIGAKLLSC